MEITYQLWLKNVGASLHEQGGARHETGGAANYEHTWHVAAGGRGQWGEMGEGRKGKGMQMKCAIPTPNWFYSPNVKWWMEEGSEVANCDMASSLVCWREASTS